MSEYVRTCQNTSGRYQLPHETSASFRLSECPQKCLSKYLSVSIFHEKYSFFLWKKHRSYHLLDPKNTIIRPHRTLSSTSFTYLSKHPSDHFQSPPRSPTRSHSTPHRTPRSTISHLPSLCPLKSPEFHQCH